MKILKLFYKLFDGEELFTLKFSSFFFLRYYVQLPDSRLMTVEYFADETGYHPTITFEGEAQFDNGPGQFQGQPSNQYQQPPAQSPSQQYGQPSFGK